MVEVCLVYEPKATEAVELFVDKLRENGDNVQLRCQEHFPIADTMFWFLWGLSAKFDKTFIVISGEKDSILSTWISKELALQRSLGNLSNVHPIFATQDAVQSWWMTEETFIVLSTIEKQ